MTLTWTDVFINGILPFGDIITRIQKLDGSLDNLWTLIPIFQLPVFGFIPLLLMKQGIIKPGKMKEKPYDHYILFTLFIKLMVSSVSSKFEEPYNILFEIAGNYFAILLPLLIRVIPLRAGLCDKLKINDKLKNNVYFKVFGIAGIMQIIIYASIFVFTKLPYIGEFFNLVSNLPVVNDSVIFITLFMFVYSLGNMMIENDLKVFCRNQENASLIGVLGAVSVVGAAYILKLNKDYAEE